MTKKQSDKYTINMLRAKKYSLEEISEVFQVPVEEIEQIKKQQI